MIHISKRDIKDPDLAKVIAFDLDGTLCQTAKFNFGYDPDTLVHGIYRSARPIGEMIDIVRDYKEMEWYVYIHTSRNERFRSTTEDWLKDYEVPYDALVMNKLFARIYVGDEVVTPQEMMQSHRLKRRFE